MKKVSVKLFFAVLWKGVCQAVAWFFGLFGYKKEGLYGFLVWRLFAASITVILALFAVIFTCKMVDIVYEKYYEEKYCYDPDCCNSEYLSQNLYYHNSDDGKGYVFNSLTKEKIIRNMDWIYLPEGEDSLVCFSDGKKRGYFNKNTGEVVIPARYNHAWLFSEGLASVEDDGSIKFIDESGNTVIDNVTPYRPGMDGLFFHDGYCVVDQDGPELSSLIDKSGKSILPLEYNSISYHPGYALWKVCKGDEQGVYDKNVRMIVPLTKGNIEISDGTINVTMADHTIRKYDLVGSLIDDFYITDVRSLDYEKDEIINRPPTLNVVEEEFAEVLDNNSRVKGIARLRAYVAGDDYEGLITADGHRVTLPLYQNIDAIGYDLYLCTVSNGDKIIINGKGEPPH